MTGDDWLRFPQVAPFFDALIEEAEAGAFDPVDFLTLIAGECDLIWLPRPNAYGYQGLTQMGPRELLAVGWTPAMGPFCRAAPEIQMRYSARYFAGHRKHYGIKRWTSAGHLWAANLAPAHLSRVDGVVYSELEHGAQYRANRWLDMNHDGIITREELTLALETVAVPRSRGRYDLALEGLASVTEARAPRTNAPSTWPAAVIDRERPSRP